MRGTASQATVVLYKHAIVVALVCFCDQFSPISRRPPCLGDNNLEMWCPPAGRRHGNGTVMGFWWPRCRPSSMCWHLDICRHLWPGVGPVASVWVANHNGHRPDDGTRREREREREIETMVQGERERERDDGTRRRCPAQRSAHGLPPCALDRQQNTLVLSKT